MERLRKITVSVLWIALVAAPVNAVEYSSSTQLALHWSGSDDVSGLAGVMLYWRREAGPWQRSGDLTTTNPLTFDSAATTEPEGLFGFATVGVDNVGNVESLPTTPDLEIIIDVGVVDPPTLLPEPRYSQGSTNTVAWVRASTAPIDLKVTDLSSSPPTIHLYKRINDPGTTTFTVTDLVHAHRYEYRVRHVDGDEVSVWSEPVYSTQDALPPITHIVKPTVAGPTIRDWERLP